ncbi:hypothetical protein B0H10DRAFT_1947623 [Mycena sp. CBHHK59/15]|nr:hypothetical protein B0H10DRAFT_1947623 [Mycena sp. CBHHK59/15]
MDTHQTFKKSDWIAQDKAWATVPSGVKKIAVEFFLIPQEHEHLLPLPFLPIAKMLEFPLPLKNATPAQLSTNSLHAITKFVVDANSGIARSGDAEASAGESESEAVPLGRGQRKKTVARRYQGPTWEEH